MWAVIDPVMRAVITETQGFSAVETRASSLAFWHYIIVLLDAYFEPDRRELQTLLNAGFELCILVLHRWLRRGLQAHILAIGVKQRRGLRPLRLGTAVMLSCSLQALRLGHCSDVEKWVLTLASWYCANGYD